MTLCCSKCDVERAKYEMVMSLRTHIGADDVAHRCISDAEDPEGLPGVRLDKAIVPAAARALKTHLISLGPRVLPISELVRFIP